MTEPLPPSDHPSLHLPLRTPTPVSRPDTISPKDPCWCLSGKTFERCHLGRENMRPFNPYRVADAIRKELSRRYCSYADDAGDPCGKEIVNAHSIQKEGGLRAIARSGKVYSFLATLAGLARTGGVLEPRLVGIRDASVFTGFCSTHDNGLFTPIEGKTCEIGPREALLFAYRAASFEAFMKGAQRAVAPLYARLDEGLPVEQQEEMQNMARGFYVLAPEGEAATRARKTAYYRRVRTNDLSDFRYAWVRFEGLLPLACCGTFLPDNDLMGRPLQRIGYGSADFEQVTLNIMSYQGQSVAVFGWVGAAGGPAERFVRSFSNLPDAVKAHCALRLALDYVENSFVGPTWWDALSSDDHRSLMRRTMFTFGNRSAWASITLASQVPGLGVIGVAGTGGSTAQPSSST